MWGCGGDYGMTGLAGGRYGALGSGAIRHTGLIVTSEPADEPITVAEAKLQTRVDSTLDDTLIAAYITAARKYVEMYTGRTLVETTYQLSLDRFPLGTFSPSHMWSNPGEYGEIELPRPPLVSVTTIKYDRDTDGVETTLSASNYRVDTDSEPGRITPSFSNVWPTPRFQTSCVRIVYKGGYGAAADVPESFKQAMRLLVGMWYVRREPVTDLRNFPVPFTVESLLMGESLRAYH